jgi:hypothetical protein
LTDFTCDIFPYPDPSSLSNWLRAQQFFQWPVHWQNKTAESSAEECPLGEKEALLTLYRAHTPMQAATATTSMQQPNNVVNDPFGYLNAGDDDDNDDDLFELLTNTDKKSPASAPMNDTASEPAMGMLLKESSVKQQKNPDSNSQSLSNRRDQGKFTRNPWENWTDLQTPLSRWAGITTSVYPSVAGSRNQAHIQSIVLRNAGLDSMVPAELLAACQHLVYLDLSHNKLVGGLSIAGTESTPEHASLPGASVSDTNISLSVRYLFLAGNCLSGGVWQAICTLRMCEVVDISDNQLTEPIPSSMTVSMSHLRDLNATNNMITGK